MAAFILASTVLTLPLDIAGGYAVRRRFGLSTQSFGGWLADRAKGTILGLIFAVAAGEILGIGSGANGELGPATTAPINTTPVEVTLPGEVGAGNLLAAGDRFSLVASTGGQLYGFGDDDQLTPR